MNIGIVGSKVDPLHYGHLFLGERACEIAQLDLCYYLPVGQPVDKDEPITDREIRCEMAVAGTHHDPRFAVSRLEVDRPGYSYMVDTLRLLRAQHGDQHNYFLIIGADRAVGLDKWKSPAELVTLCEFLVANRAGEREAVSASWLKQVMPAGARARALTVPNVNFSSTQVRALVRTGGDITYMVPPAVRRIIGRRGLYRA